MNAIEYKRTWENGQKNFAKMEHSKAICKLMDIELNDIIDFPNQPYEKIREYQLKKIIKLVDYDYKNIPLYREKYDAVGFKPGDIKTFEDFEKLPFLYKDELIDGFPDKIVKDQKDWDISTRSSGSSGRFATIALDVDAIYHDTMQGIRQYVRQSDFKYKKSDRVLFIYTCPWWISDIYGDYELDFLPTTTNVKETVEHIKKTRPFIISTYPTYLSKICSLKVKLSDYGVGYVIVHSEQSDKKTRDKMAKALGVTIYDEYSSEELTRIALECSGGLYHIEEDASYIEVIDRDTHKNITDGVGVVVGTNLINKVTPLIRYWQNDVVTIDSKVKCSCGSHFRTITKVNGREMDCIISKNEKIPASAFMDLAYNWFLKKRVSVMGMKYQIAQVANDEIVVYLQKGIYDLTNDEEYLIKDSLYSLVDKSMNVKIQYTNRFIQSSSKFKPVIRIFD